MIMQELPDAPTLEVKIGRPELLRHNRWNAGYFEERFRQNEKKLKKLRSVSLDNFIPEELPLRLAGWPYPCDSRCPASTARICFSSAATRRG